MNLFVELLGDYLKSECDKALKAATLQANKVTLVVQSLPLHETAATIHKIDGYFTANHPGTERAIKISLGLWNSWSLTERQLIAPIDTFEHDWVDSNDQLTTYRNKTNCIFFGFDHASDKGSLKDFHLVDEDLLWDRVLLGSFDLWVEQIAEVLNDHDASAKAGLLAYLEAVHKFNARSLVRVSQFFQSIFSAVPPTLKDFVRCCHEQLPKWQGLPLLNLPVGRNLPRVRRLIELSHRFSTHALFGSLNDRNKAKTKLAKAEGGISPYQEFELPAPVKEGDTTYLSASDYLDDVRRFIDENDRQALARLQGWDAQPLLELLEKKERKTTGPSKATALRGYSDVVFLQAILLSLQSFIEEYGQAASGEAIETLEVCLNRFVSDGEEPLDEVRQLLGGILGVCIPDELVLTRDDEQTAIGIRFGGLEDLATQSTTAISRLEFSTRISSSADTDDFVSEFIWALPATHPERLRLVLSEQALKCLAQLVPPRLPAFRIGGFDEMFYATDEDDANRLLLLGVHQFDVTNALAGLALPHVSPVLVNGCSTLTALYKDLLESILAQGFYAGNVKVHKVITKYEELVDTVTGHQALGAEQIVPRLYRAFLAVRTNDLHTNDYLSAAVVLPISPFVLELSRARAVFLRDGFPEVVEELFQNGKSAAQLRWERLVGLAELRRPIVGLVCDANKSLTTRIRSFGLTHLLGNPDDAQLSVASQSLMREKGFEEDDLGERLRPTAASRMYERLIADYQVLHHHSGDQLNLLFANVLEIETLLSGVDRWLRGYLKGAASQPAPFVLNVKVITTGVAVTTALNILMAWRDQWAESEFSELRRCSIQIGHRHAQTVSELNSMLAAERDLRFDLAIIAHFLEGQHAGDHLERSAPFDSVEGSKLRQFPIAEYPRPTMIASAGSYRRTLISNRRIRMASKHTEIAARLKDPQADVGQQYVVLAQVDFVPWQETIALLHKKALWVACIDRYVDRNLLSSSVAGQALLDRRVVGFSCGLGDYGELNQTVSTEANDLVSLTKTIGYRLRGYFSNLSDEQAELAAHNVVATAGEIPGLSLVRAAGHDEYIRDVIGYSLIARLLGRDEESLLQVLIPLDSFRHWFFDREDSNIPDLLSLSAHLVGGQIQIRAVVIECKFAQESLQLSDKAFAQASSGLRQLARIFAPNGAAIKGVVFERKYWWAQLHRALSSRAMVTLPLAEYEKLCSALERLGEGRFQIAWQSMACTFWLNKDGIDHTPKNMGSVDVGAAIPLPSDFGVYQLQFGADDVIELLTQGGFENFKVPGAPLVFSEVFSEPVVKSATGSAPSDEEQTDTTAIAPTESVSKGESAEQVVAAASGTQQQAPSIAGKVPDLASIAGSPPPSRLLLGVDHKGEDVFWEYGDSELENRHLLIFGGSGAGKTYAIQGLLLEMARFHQHAAIIDYTDGFLPSHLDAAFAKQVSPLTHVLVNKPFPINPFQRLSKEEPGIGHIQERPHNVASRVSDVFCTVYNVGDVQRGALAKYIEKGLIEHADFSLEDLLSVLETADDVPPNLALKISELVKQKPFSAGTDAGWGSIYGDAQPIQILQLTALSKDIQRLIAEFALWDLFAYAARHGSKDRPLPLVLDEVQNLDHRSDRALDKLLREGRKFGVGLILATQTIANFDKEQRSRLFQAGHKLFFKPAETERKEFAQILADVSPNRTRDEWIAELSKLGKGECWSIGPRRVTQSGVVKRDPIKIRIASIEARLQK